MGTSTDSMECRRCGNVFGFRQPHTEIVRRDFLEAPEPAVVEHLCEDCWRDYVEDFLDEPFEHLR